MAGWIWLTGCGLPTPEKVNKLDLKTSSRGKGANQLISGVASFSSVQAYSLSFRKKYSKFSSPWLRMMVTFSQWLVSARRIKSYSGFSVRISDPPGTFSWRAPYNCPWSMPGKWLEFSKKYYRTCLHHRIQTAECFATERELWSQHLDSGRWGSELKAFSKTSWLQHTQRMMG